MDRSAIFVDAGYLWAAGGRLTCGTSTRARVSCDCRGVTSALAGWAREHSGGLDSLRTYWYDGAVNAVPTPHHEEVGNLSYVKVRLGRLPADFWGAHFRPADEGQTSAATASPDQAQSAGRRFADSWIRNAKAEDLDDLHARRPRIPRELDVQLIVAAEKELGRLFEREDLKRELRAGFWVAIEEAARLAQTGELDKPVRDQAVL